jgi:hypothetical protein
VLVLAAVAVAVAVALALALVVTTGCDEVGTSVANEELVKSLAPHPDMPKLTTPARSPATVRRATDKRCRSAKM